jgi:hypothetical protein
MSTTDELPLRLPAPEVSPEEIERVCAWLRGRGWMRAVEIETALGIDDRRLRAIAEHSEARILSSPGRAGYRFFDREALPDAERAIHAFGSQIRKMEARRAGYVLRYHNFARSNPTK